MVRMCYIDIGIARAVPWRGEARAKLASHKYAHTYKCMHAPISTVCKFEFQMIIR